MDRKNLQNGSDIRGVAIHNNENGEECWLANETSGNGALKENCFLDDGAFLVAKILIKYAHFFNQGDDQG